MTFNVDDICAITNKETKVTKVMRQDKPMFFKYNIYEEISDKYVSLKNAELCGDKPENTFIEKYIANVCRIDVEQEEEITCSQMKLMIGFPCNILKRTGVSQG